MRFFTGGASPRQPENRTAEDKKALPRPLAYRLIRHKKVMLTNAMATQDAPKTIGEVIDHVERLREELLVLQRSLERMEHAAAAVSDAEAKSS
jgi:hypothetical protein